MSTLPHSLEAEQAVLACAMLDPALAKRVVAEVREADFFAPANRAIWTAMARVHGAERLVDLVTVRSALDEGGLLAVVEAVGGEAYLATLDLALPDVGRFDQYVGVLRDYRLRREMLREAGLLHAAALEGTDRPADTLATASLHLRRLEAHIVSDRPRPITELAHEALKVMAERKPGQTWGVPSGITDLDRLTCGYDKGSLVVIAGLPGSGKTSLMLQTAAHCALDHEIPTCVYSVEMSARELTFRVLAARAGVDYSKIRGGYLKAMQREELAHAARKMGGLPLLIDANAKTPHDICVSARRLQRESGLGLVVVDYLQLMPGVGENRNQEIANITRALKLLGQELNVPVLLGSQLSRDCAKEKRRPRQSDLRDSGAIEQDSDFIVFTHRPYLYDEKTEDERIAELIVAKQRNGPTAIVKVAWIPELMSFRNLAH